MKQTNCDKLGALGIRKGKGLWNGIVLNLETNRWRGRMEILLSNRMQHMILEIEILILGKVQWMVCSLDKQNIGF